MKRKRAEVTAAEIADAISKAYPDCRPLTEDQVYYYLIKTGKLGRGEADFSGYRGMINNWGDEKVSTGIFLNHSPGFESPFLKIRSVEDRKINHRKHLIERITAIPDFEIWKDQDNHVELWVDDEAVTEFLRIHHNDEIRVPIHDAGRFYDPGPLDEAKARLDYMKNVEDKSIVILTLTDYDVSGFETHFQLKELFEEQIDEMTRIGVNEEQIRHLPRKPRHLVSAERRKEERLFQKEFGHKGCYSVHAVEPQALLEIVSTEVGMRYDMSKYPGERVARWRKAQETLRTSLEAVFDELFELARIETPQ